MQTVICFPKENPRYCIELYYSKDLPPLQGPVIPKRKDFVLLNPHFSEVIKAELISKDLVTDIAILSAISELTKQLSPELGKSIQQNIKAINKQINLENKGVEVKIR
ncbi:hypothetical protein [Runella aurantiaca]|uniref:Uncharacterized protein n=1 Tax=Runella aurantiaca TaxID=2282308 RepID=A0A369IAS2_9BACT|nr:hypothetical protein [Runella aurantiaca]RDB05960.1 hypothetical protein DVG78_11170 [Runella aurantiaca]